MAETNIKIVFFDIDGTTYDAERKYVSPSTIKAINELHDKGIYTVISTGRGRNEIVGITKELMGLPFDAFITSGGSEVYTRDGTLLHQAHIKREHALNIKKLLEDVDFHIDCIYTDGIGSGVTGEMGEYGNLNFKWFEIPPYPKREFDVDSLIHVIFAVGEEYHEKIISYLEGTNYDVTSPISVEVYPCATTKLTGINVLLEHFGLTLDNVMAFGDSENDVEMLEYAAIGVCMGNGKEITKKHSDYVCEDIFHDGIYNTLKKYGVI